MSEKTDQKDQEKQKEDFIRLIKSEGILFLEIYDLEKKLII